MALSQNAPALHKRWSSLAPCQVMLCKQSSGIGYKRLIPSVVRACAEEEAASPARQGITGRREVLTGVGAFTASIFSTDTALAEQSTKGYQVVLDKFDGYSFIYPFGWQAADTQTFHMCQEVVVKGQDKVYKDVIEPLESVSISIVPTDKKDIHDLGSAEEVAGTLVRRVLSSPSQKTELLNVQERTTEGRNYYSFEFIAKAPKFTRHALATIAIGNGKFYTLTTGANERRWSKMKDKLHAVADSFKLYTV